MDSGDGWVDVSERYNRREPDRVTTSALERVKAICRQRYLAGEKREYSYPGIEEDLKAEQAEMALAREPGQEG